MTRRTCIALITALTIVAVVRVASTHRVLSETVDEPLHLASGWLWLGGSYVIDIAHPPLARALAALPLRFAGIPDPPPGSDVERGNFLLYYGDRYEKHLARARMGNLLLFIASILAVAALASRAFGNAVAVAATALFTTLPPVLAHAGLATTDMAVTAALPLALLALDRLIEWPSPGRAAALGAALAMGVLGKFSFVVFFPAAAVVLLAVRRRLRFPWRVVAVVFLTAFVLIWAGYLFAFGPISSAFYGAAFFFEASAPDALRSQARWFADHVPIPAPALPAGLALLKFHDDQGHQAYLLGETSTHGWWYYFPIVFFFKTPLPFLALTLMGMAWALRRRVAIEHALVPVAILLVAMTGSINIGVRHVLPMYASLAIVAAYALLELWRRAIDPFARLGVAALVTWLFAGVAAGHPDYLSWFNEAAGKHPAGVAVDSNLDWGQDVLRLERTVRQFRIDKLHILYSSSALLEQHGIRAEAIPVQPASGWIAVGETPWATWGERYAWLNAYEPVRRVGKSIRLYYIP